jgi:hypothetical protein
MMIKPCHTYFADTAMLASRRFDEKACSALTSRMIQDVVERICLHMLSMTGRRDDARSRLRAEVGENIRRRHDQQDHKVVY